MAVEDLCVSAVNEELNFPFFWDLTLHRWVSATRRFERTYCINLQLILK
jgi:hypothetical protein